MINAPAPSRNPAMREAMRDLTQSLRSSDLTGARQAYAAILKNAPDGAQLTKGSDFADLGRALVQGDMTSAQASFKSMIQGRFGGGPVTPLPPVAQSARQVGTGVDLIA